MCDKTIYLTSVVISSILGTLTALIAALPRVFSNDISNIFFPITWFLGVGAIAVIANPVVIFLPARIKAPSFRVIRFLSYGFLLGYIFLFIAGFDWTGDSIRFLMFRSGLRDEQLIHITGPTDWRVYYWRGWGFAGLENDAYLIFDPSNRLSLVTADANSLGINCEIVESRQMAPFWRLVITFNCTFS